LFSIAQLHQRALAYESRFKETSKSVARTIHLVERDDSDDESANVYTVEFVWPTKAKYFACSSFQPIQKNWQQETKFTFNVAKCDRIFDELLKNGNIKLTHTIPPMDELKRRAYCKWHNYFPMPPMVVMFFVDRNNRPYMRADWLFRRCKWTYNSGLVLEIKPSPKESVKTNQPRNNQVIQ
jgi:hypothetical protein